MGDEESVRDVLVRHSDSRPCRELFEIVVAGERPADSSLDARDYVEVLSATAGDLCLVVQDGLADIYLRWDGRGGFEQLTVWPPWSVVDYDSGLSRSTLEALVDATTDPRPLVYADSPFAHGHVLGSLPGLSWP